VTSVRGASVLVWRRGWRGPEWLVLHRAAAGPAYDGDWAWTPPAGARRAGEDVAECARRELLEETGLELEPVPTGCGSDEWAVFVAEAPPEAEVRLDREHDAYEWVSEDEAAARCLPAHVGAAFNAVSALVGGGRPG
jgi:8-oxo-dGTP pyrophosphatase MutT (NUDIX family)